MGILLLGWMMTKISNKILLLTGLCLSLSSQADNYHVFDQEIINPVMLDESDLIKDPKLLESFILQAIDQYRTEDLRLLRTLIDQNTIDPFVYHYGLGYLAMQDGDYKQAIRHFEHILKINQDFNQISLLLMQALAFDKQYARADDILVSLLEDPRVNNEMKQRLAQDQKWLKNQQAWQTSLGGGMLHDANINNSPKIKNYQGWQLSPPVTASGINISAAAQKNTNFYQNFSLQTQLGFDVKYYNKHQFNDIHALVGTGIAYQDSDSSAGVMPFYQKRWYGNKPYSDTVGARLWYQQQFSPKASIGLSGAAGQIKHQERKFLDGHYFNTSIGVYGSSQWMNINHHQQHAQEDSESYQDYGVSFGFLHSWQPVHLTHRFSANYRHYGASDIFNITRRDWRYETWHRLWHERFQYRGYIPSLNVNYERVDSNHFAFDTEDIQAYFEIHKHF